MKRIGVRVSAIVVCYAGLARCGDGTAPEADAGCGIGTAALTGVSVHADSHVAATGAPFAVAVAKDVAYISRIGNGDIVKVRLPNLAPARNIKVGAVPTEIAFNPAGTLAYVTNQSSQNIGVINVAIDTQIATIAVSGNPFGIAVSHDGRALYVTTNRDSLLSISTSSRAVTGQLFMPQGSSGMAVCHSLLYVSTLAAGTVTEIETNPFRVRRTFPVGGAPEKIVISPMGTELYIANQQGTVEFWDVTNNASLGSVPISGPGFGLAQSPGDGRLYVTTFNTGQVQVVDPLTRTKVDSFVVGGQVRDIGFNATGTIAVVANESGWVDFLH